MIELGTCQICRKRDGYVYSSPEIRGLCPACLREAARVTERHRQIVAAANRDINLATMRIFAAITQVANRTHDAPMTLGQISKEADRVKSCVSWHVDKLVEAGLVERGSEVARSIWLTREPSLWGSQTYV